jgi:putative SOS response-associated peptidase YedK
MSVILRPQDEARYLNPTTSLDELRQLLLPYPEEAMILYPVTTKLCRATTNSKEFIQPITVQSLPDSVEDAEEIEQLPLLD